MKLSLLQDPGTLRLAAFLGVLGVMLVCESLWPKRRWETPRAKRVGVHLSISLFNTLLTRVLVVAPLLAWLHFVTDKGWGLAHLIGLQGTAEIVATFVVFDALDYWWHRFNHQWSFLWRFHRAHHMDTHVDVTTALRFHTGELILSGLAKAIWIFLWGPTLIGFIIFEAGITAFAQFHHANIDFPDRIQRALRELIMTPRVHTSHHTVTIRTRDANYATIFAVWDKIFGSFREPDFKEMRLLGLEEGRKNYLSIMDFLKTPFVIMVLLSCLGTHAFAQTALGETGKRTFELTYQGEILLPDNAKAVELWIPLASSREGQKILKRTIDLPYSHRITQEPTYKNEMIYLKVENAKNPIPFKIQYRAIVDQRLFEKVASRADSALYLKSSRFMSVGEKIRSIAKTNLPENASLLDKARAIYDYVIGHMQYDKSAPGWGRGDTQRACDIGKGNCTDFHSLFISVAHAADIPARFKIGFQVPPGPEGTIAGYHCWAEFSDDNKIWNPVDASEAWKHPENRESYFAHFDPNKFLISLGRDIALSPKQKGEPVNIFFYPYVEADGKAIENVSKMEFSYRDLNKKKEESK
jgi:sterol desaturase/sphingolipid hydroxylase (fatty acid hydroxylase superfamily)